MSTGDHSGDNPQDEHVQSFEEWEAAGGKVEDLVMPDGTPVLKSPARAETGLVIRGDKADYLHGMAQALGVAGDVLGAIDMLLDQAEARHGDAPKGDRLAAIEARSLARLERMDLDLRWFRAAMKSSFGTVKEDLGYAKRAAATGEAETDYHAQCHDHLLAQFAEHYAGQGR